jgi:hypothetical protein
LVSPGWSAVSEQMPAPLVIVTVVPEIEQAPESSRRYCQVRTGRSRHTEGARGSSDSPEIDGAYPNPFNQYLLDSIFS